MSRLLLTLCLLAACGAAAAQDRDLPDAARAEIIRRGNLATRVDGSIRQGGGAVFGEIVGMPADDSHKWFVTLVTLPRCNACERLKADLDREPLAAWVNRADPKSSWSHFNSYFAGDRTQDWRWRNMRITSYPTLIIQPPLSGVYGSPSKIVLQVSGYHGDPEKLSATMAAAIRQHVASLQPPANAPRYLHTYLRENDQGHGQSDDTGVPPPFPLTPQTPPGGPAGPFVWPPNLPTQVPAVPELNPDLMTLLTLAANKLGLGEWFKTGMLVWLVGFGIWKRWIAKPQVIPIQELPAPPAK